MILKVNLILLLFFWFFFIDLNVAKGVESIVAVDSNEEIVSIIKDYFSQIDWMSFHIRSFTGMFGVWVIVVTLELSRDWTYQVLLSKPPQVNIVQM